MSPIAFANTKINNNLRRYTPQRRRWVFVRNSEIGLGVFTAVPLRTYDLAFFINGSIVSTIVNETLEHEGSYSIQIGLDSYIDPVSPGRFINHSCSPNVGLRDNSSVIALRPITAGEELRFDYSTSMLERSWSLECACGNAACRKKILDFDYLPETLQRYYLAEKVVQPFISDYLENGIIEPVADIVRQRHEKRETPFLVA